MGSFEIYGNNLRFFWFSIRHKARMHGFCFMGHILQLPKSPSCSKFHSFRTIRKLGRTSIYVHLHTSKRNNCSPPVCVTILVTCKSDLWVVSRSRLRDSDTGSRKSCRAFVAEFSLPIPSVFDSIICSHTQRLW